MMTPYAWHGLHMHRDIRGDLSSKDHRKHERTIFHDRHQRVVIRLHHLRIPFLLKLSPCTREAAIMAPGESKQFV